jgi:Domain of unknown function (DUF5655)
MPDAPLWTCPACGQSFVARNMPHSCQVVALDEFFAGSPPELRELFELFVAAARENGPVTVNATKTRIALQARMRFAAVQRPRERFLAAHVVLTRPIESPRLAVEYLPPYYYVHRLRLARPADIDDELRGWLAEAYRVGEQRHVDDPDWPKARRPPDWVSRPPSRS